MSKTNKETLSLRGNTVREDKYTYVESILETLVSVYDPNLNFQFQADTPINEII